MSDPLPLNTGLTPHRDTFRKASFDFVVKKIILQVQGSNRFSEIFSRVGLSSTTYGMSEEADLYHTVFQPFMQRIYGQDHEFQAQLLRDTKYRDTHKIGQGLYCDVLAIFVNRTRGYVNSVNIHRSIGEKVTYTANSHITKAIGIMGNDMRVMKIHQGETILYNASTVNDVITKMSVHSDMKTPLKIMCKNICVEVHAYPVQSILRLGAEMRTYNIFTISLHNAKYDQGVTFEVVYNTLLRAEVLKLNEIEKPFIIDAGNLKDGNLIIKVFDDTSHMLFSISSSLIKLHQSLLSQIRNSIGSTAITIQTGFGYDFPLNILSSFRINVFKSLEALDIVRWTMMLRDSTKQSMNDMAFMLLMFITIYDDINVIMSTDKLNTKNGELRSVLNKIAITASNFVSYNSDEWRIRMLSYNTLEQLKSRNVQPVHYISSRINRAVDAISEAQGFSHTII